MCVCMCLYVKKYEFYWEALQRGVVKYESRSVLYVEKLLENRTKMKTYREKETAGHAWDAPGAV